MAKELYIYSPLYDFTAESVVKQLNDISDDEELTIRMNTPGGDVMAGWSIISKMSERKAKTNAIIDGDASSMGAMMLVFFDNVIANDTSSIMFHKAAYPSYYNPNEAELQKVKSVNQKFKEKLESKVNGNPGAEDFIKKVFEADIRNDVEITPVKAKSLGIVNDVRKLEPKAYQGMQIVAMIDTDTKKVKAPESSGESNIHLKRKSMDLQTLKAEHPAVYALAHEEGVTKGTLNERDRVEAWAVFNEVDPVKVKAGIESGKTLKLKEMAEFQLQATSGQKLEAIEEENPGETDTSKEVKTEEQLQAETDNKILNEELGEPKAY